jgi:hypothetical protein
MPSQHEPGSGNAARRTAVTEGLRPDDLANCATLVLQHIDDGADGSLTVAQRGGAVPFELARVYYITRLQNPGAIRGKHAHKTLEQAIFCVNGSFRLDLDDGARRTSLVLDTPNVGVYMGPLLWHEMRDFSPDCVILVLASDVYDEPDYLRSYDAFIEYAAARRAG